MVDNIDLTFELKRLSNLMWVISKCLACRFSTTISHLPQLQDRVDLIINFKCNLLLAELLNECVSAIAFSLNNC